MPRAAIRDADTVYVVNADSRLSFRTVEIHKREREPVIVKSGLESQESVCVSRLDATVEELTVISRVDGTTIRVEVTRQLPALIAAGPSMSLPRKEEEDVPREWQAIEARTQELERDEPAA